MGAPSPDPPRRRTFRSRPELGPRLGRPEESLAAAEEPVSVRQLRGAALRFLMARRVLLRAARGFFVASTFSLLFLSTLISQFSSSRRMFLFLAISFSLISVWALVYGAV